MFKKIPMGMAALTFFTIGDCEAIKLDRHHNNELTQLSAESVPNCTSYECHNNMALIGYAGPTEEKEEEAKKAVLPVEEKEGKGEIKGDKGNAAMQVVSDPTWNSAEGYTLDTAHLDTYYLQTESIPSCTSYKCKKNTASAPFMNVPGYEYETRPIMAQTESIPSCTSYKCKKNTASAPFMNVPGYEYETRPIMAQQESIPACTSYKCKKESAGAPYMNVPGYEYENRPIMAQTESIPSCTSYKCKKNTASAPFMNVPGYEYETRPIMAQQESIPACNSHQHNEKKCETETAAAPLMQVGSESIPACNSHQHNEKKCETETAAAPLMQVSSIPACNSYQHNEKKCETETAAAPLMQVSSDSIPACTSYECKKRDASQVIDENAVQVESDPICSSAGCVSQNKPPYPINYKVPNFGLDKDIIDSQYHENEAAGKLHALRDKARKSVKAAQATESAPAKAADVQLESDPNCNSVECFTHHTLWKEEEKVIDYPVSTKDTLDDDLKMTQAHISAAETSLKKKWTYKPSDAGYNFVGLDEQNMADTEWRKDWRQHRYHFRNNYKNFPAKRGQRTRLHDQMMDNWGTNKY